MELDVYELGWLAGGPYRVAEVALVQLRERGDVTVVGPRVRAAEGAADPAWHPVERQVVELCPRGSSLAAVLADVAKGSEVARIRGRLRRAGLLRRFRSGPTRAGRRELAAARERGGWPAYVFDGPAALPDRRLAWAVAQAHPLPAGLGKALRKMGRALDRADHDHDHGDGGGGGGHSCGGGGGGGGGGD